MKSLVANAMATRCSPMESRWSDEIDDEEIIVERGNRCWNVDNVVGPGRSIARR